MIGACIPSLKPLFKAVLSGSSKRYPPNQTSGNKGHVRNDTLPSSKSYEMYGGRSKNTTVVSGGIHENESEESILDAPGGIRRPLGFLSRSTERGRPVRQIGDTTEWDNLRGLGKITYVMA